MQLPNKQVQLQLQLAALFFLVVPTAVSQNSSEYCQQHAGNPALLFLKLSHFDKQSKNFSLKGFYFSQTLTLTSK